jgi:hypothetical protein
MAGGIAGTSFATLGSLLGYRRWPVLLIAAAGFVPEQLFQLYAESFASTWYLEASNSIPSMVSTLLIVSVFMILLIRRWQLAVRPLL